MTDEAHELHRIISASVRDMLTEYRLQSQPGPVTEKALEQTGPSDHSLVATTASRT